MGHDRERCLVGGENWKPETPGKSGYDVEVASMIDDWPVLVPSPSLAPYSMRGISTRQGAVKRLGQPNPCSIIYIIRYLSSVIPE
jgi:hypothetical protein